MDSEPKTDAGSQLDPVLRRLLDHIVDELARAYVRRMEAAARNEGDGGEEQEDR